MADFVNTVNNSIFLFYNLTIDPIDSSYYKIKSQINLKELSKTSLKGQEVYDYFYSRAYCPSIDVDFINIYYANYQKDDYTIKILFMEVLNSELVTPNLVFNSSSKALLTLFDRHIKITNDLVGEEKSFELYLSQFIEKLTEPRFYNLTQHNFLTNIATKLFDYQIDNINWMTNLENNIQPDLITDNKIFFFPDGRIFNYTKNTFETSIELVKVKGGIIMDDVGIGKTLQLLCLALSTPMLNTLILVPDHLVTHWNSEISKHFINPCDFIKICSYSNFNEKLLDGIGRLIVDEIHELYSLTKNLSLYKKLCETKIQFKWGISATPFAHTNSIYYILKYLTDINFTYTNMFKFKFHFKVYDKIFRKNTLASIIKEIQLPSVSEHNLLINFSPNEKMIYDSELVAKENCDINFLRKICCDVMINFSNNNVNVITIDNFNKTILKNFKDKYDEQIINYNSMEQMIISCSNSVEKCKNQIEKIQLEQNLFTFKNKLNQISNALTNRKNAYEFLKRQIEETKECAICLLSFHSNSETGSSEEIMFDILPCSHIYCSSCFEKWSKINNSNLTCPTCRKLINKNDVYRISNNKMSYSSKVTKILNIIKSKSNEQFIIFTQFEKMIANLHNIFSLEGIQSIIFNDWSDIEKFKNDSSATQVLILSSLNNASGIDLSFVKNMIISEPLIGTNEFLRDIEKQIIGRIYRIKQTNPINVYRIILKNTIEEDIYFKII